VRVMDLSKAVERREENIKRNELLLTSWGGFTLFTNTANDVNIMKLLKYPLK